MENSFIPKGMEFVKQAVEADNADDLTQALELYKKGLSYFVTGLKYVNNPRQENAIREKMGQYLARAEQIKEALDARDNPNAKKVALADGGAKSPTHDGKEGDKPDAKDSKGNAIDPETAKLEASLSGAIVKETPNVHWDDVAGLEQAKGLLKEAVILPVRFPQLFTNKRKPWKGILLYGPPGTGKSFLAKAVATEAASCFLSVSSSDLVSKYQGESERLVRSLFELARKSKPAIIFVDEVDSLAGTRGEGENESSRRIKTEFLVQMQGVGKDQEGVLVLGATNTPWELDPAIRRRFEKRVYIPLPEVRARYRIFKLSLGDTPNNITDPQWQELAERTESFSGADISVLVRDALYEPVRICQLATHFKKVKDPEGKYDCLYEPCSSGVRDALEMSLFDVPAGQLQPIPVTFRHFENALANAKPSVGHSDLQRFEDWTKQFGQDG